MIKELPDTIRTLVLAFFLLVLPWIFILIGIIINIAPLLQGGLAAWYYILSITWFGAGLIFFWVLK